MKSSVALKSSPVMKKDELRITGVIIIAFVASIILNCIQESRLSELSQEVLELRREQEVMEKYYHQSDSTLLFVDDYGE